MEHYLTLWVRLNFSWMKRIKNLAAFSKKTETFHTRPGPDTISRHSQMLAVNASAAGEALVGIFSVVSLCLFLPGSVRTVHSRGYWPSSGCIAAFYLRACAQACARIRTDGWNQIQRECTLCVDTHANFHLQESHMRVKKEAHSRAAARPALSCLCLCVNGCLTLCTYRRKMGNISGQVSRQRDQNKRPNDGM